MSHNYEILTQEQLAQLKNCTSWEQFFTATGLALCFSPSIQYHYAIKLMLHGHIKRQDVENLFLHYPSPTICIIMIAFDHAYSHHQRTFELEKHQRNLDFEAENLRHEALLNFLKEAGNNETLCQAVQEVKEELNAMESGVKRPRSK